MTKRLSPVQCVERLEDRREIKNLLGKYVLSLHLCKYEDIVGQLWCKTKDDIALGFNDGRYHGRESVEAYYHFRYEKTVLGTRLLRKALPKAFEGKSEDECYGAGCLEFKPVQTPVIEIDDERKYAGVWWYSQGNMSEITKEGPVAFWTWGSFHAVCIREDDEWRIYKLDYFEDIKSPVGHNWNRPYKEEVNEQFKEIGDFHAPCPEEKNCLHEAYNVRKKFAGVLLPDKQTFYDFSTGGLGAADVDTLQAAADRDEIEQLMGRRVILDANEARAREFEELWVKSPEHEESMCYGGTLGFYVGKKAVYGYYVEEHKKRLTDNGEGSFSVAPLRTPAIQVAGDRQSAKGIWYSMGLAACDGGDVVWVCKKVAVDFLKEDGRWKIWHLCEVHDSVLTPGENFGNQAAPNFGEKNDSRQFNDEWLSEIFKSVTVPVKTHERMFCWSDDFPWMPEPYEHMIPELEYSANGFFARRKEAVRF